MDQTLNLPLSDVYVDGKTYTRAELNRLGRNELRPIARSVHATLRSTVSLTWLVVNCKRKRYYHAEAVV